MESAPATAPRWRAKLRGLAGKEPEFWAYLVTRLVVAGGGLVALERLVKALTRDEYGEWGYLRAVGAMLVPLVSLSLPAAMMRLYFDRPKDDTAGHRQLASTVLALHGAMVALMVAIAVVGWVFDVFGQVESLFYAALAPAMLVGSLVTYMARTRNDVWLFFVHRVGEVVGFLALLTMIQLGWFHDSPPLRTVVIGYASMLWLVNAVALAFYARAGLIALGGPLLKWPEIGSMFRFSAPLSGTYVLGWALASSDVWFLRRLSTLGETADYVFAVGVAGSVSLVTSSALMDWPRFYYAQMRDNEPDRDDALRRKIRKFLWLHVLAIAIVRLAAQLAYPLLGADAYRGGLPAVDVLVLGNFFFLLGNLLAAGIGFAKATEWNLFTFAVPGVVNVGLNLWLIPRFGAIAAAWTTLIAYGLFAVACYAVGGHFHRFFRVRDFALPLAAALFCAFVGAPWPFR